MPAQRDAAPIPLVVWGRLALGILLGVAFTAWPYSRDCGFPLYGYLAAVFVLLVTAGWAAVGAWQRRLAVAHGLALILAFWGIVLAAEQILPRIGYAADAATWTCAPASAVVPSPAPPPSEAPPSPSAEGGAPQRAF